jgi:xanthine/uracil permease
MNLLKIVGAVAPSLATAIGGPLGGMAMQAVASALGLPTDSSEKDVEKAAASATPDQLLALKKADNDFAIRMKELDIDIERISASDRNSARQREAQVRDWMPRILAGVIVCGFMATVFLVLLGWVDGMKDPLMATTVGTLIGFVSAKAEQVIAYYFGSSSSSQAKTQLLAEKGK